MSAPAVTVIAMTPEEIRALVREELQREREAQRPPTMTQAELGSYLRKSPGALRAWLSRHRDFPRARVGGRAVYDRTAVEEWLRRHSRTVS